LRYRIYIFELYYLNISHMDRETQTRYFRQLLLPEFGEKAQEILGRSSVLIAGAGGLGSPAALYLAAAGVGRLVICDHDLVELSNLNRQILHGTTDLGNPKTESASRVLSNLNNEIHIEVHPVRLDPESVEKVAKGVDVVVDCLDNVATRQVLNHYSIQHRIPLVHGGIEGWSGQVTLLHPPETACMNCLFTRMEERSGPAPVLGAVAGLIGTIQALEVIKYLTGMPGTLKNQMLHFDGFHMEWTKVEIGRREDCEKCMHVT
jgi:adenylyltransferase/sulfurtransferase